ncbi:4504_t:CDS:2, partial [Funneliformis geosporum]
DIIDKGENGEIGIGFCTKSASLNEMPDCSWGYHGDDGNSYFDSYDEPYGTDFMTDDTIRCCLNIRNSMLFYTKNGVNL